MNTDGTTKGQRKIAGLAINNTTISINEVSDGSADRAIADITNELEQLRNIAHALQLPNADSINWTMTVSSTSDSASSQKRLNKLIKECKDADEKRYGKANIQTVSLIEGFCLHLGVNLRKAFLSGIVKDSSLVTSNDREHHPVDTLVHEFCKLFGKYVNIRKKIPGQRIHIVFTSLRKQRAVCDLQRELADFIDHDCSKYSEFAKDPSTLVGKQISHRFKVGESRFKWYKGIVLDNDLNTMKHHIEYEENEEPSYFDPNIDLLNGDLEVLD